MDYLPTGPLLDDLELSRADDLPREVDWPADE
jgi:hypothetical protein